MKCRYSRHKKNKHSALVRVQVIIADYDNDFPGISPDVAPQLKKTSFAEGVRCASLGSRRTLCGNEHVSSLKSDARMTDACLELQKSKAKKKKKKKNNKHKPGKGSSGGGDGGGGRRSGSAGSKAAGRGRYGEGRKGGQDDEEEKDEDDDEV